MSAHRLGREIVEAAQREAERLGCRLEVAIRGRSYHGWVWFAGRREPYNSACTPSDRNAKQAVIAEVRRRCRALTAIPS